jgi:hypothetical protein
MQYRWSSAKAIEVTPEVMLVIDPELNDVLSM